jgi:P27 family predicted phage terminase small subunit
MGQRGPLPNAERNQRVRPTRSKTALVAVQSPTIVPSIPVKPPAGLGKAGKAVWSALRNLQWTQPSDQLAIIRLAELEDERAVLRKALDDKGAVLKKPVTTSRGDVAGEEEYANPAIREMRRLDAQILELHKGFGLTPMARARLGLAVIAVTEKENTLAKLRARRSGA